MNKQVVLNVLLGAALFLTPGTSQARWMNPSTGRFLTMDTYGGNIRDPSDLHKYLYCRGNSINLIDPSGFSGKVTIVAVGDDSISSLEGSGHAFIIWKPDGSSTVTTYGTWGNHPHHRPNGLLENEELTRPAYSTIPSDLTREQHITSAAESKFMTLVEYYRDEGEAGWSYTWNCAGFASDAWMAATGENLYWAAEWDYPGGFLTPTKLEYEIKKANRNGYVSRGKPRSFVVSEIILQNGAYLDF